MVCFEWSISMFKTIVDTRRRSWTSFTAVCNGVISHGAQIGGLRTLGFCRPHTRKNTSKTNAATCTCISLVLIKIF